MFASGSWDNTIRIWDQTSLGCIFILNGHTQSINSIVGLGNEYLISSSVDQSIIVWDILNNFTRLTTTKTAAALYSIALFFNNSFITGDSNGFIQMFDINSLEIVFVDDLNQNSNETSSLIFKKDYLIIGLSNGFIKVWKTDSFLLWYSKKAHDSIVTCLTNIYDRNLFASGSADSQIKIWDSDFKETNFVAKFWL